jgi:molybdopterin-guanine dinucleotide biosynthesis protein A
VRPADLRVSSDGISYCGGAVAHACQQSRGGALIDPFFNVNTPEDATRAEAIALQYPDA